MMKKTKVFLGGTISSSNWRDLFTEMLDREAIEIFNPCVREWTLKNSNEEKLHSSTDDIYLCVIAPEGRGFVCTMRNYLKALSERKSHPESIVLCVLKEEDGAIIEGEQLYYTTQLVKNALKSGIIVLDSLEETAAYLNGYSVQQETASKPKRFSKKQ